VLRFSAEKELKNFKYSVEFETKEQVTSLFAPSGSGKTLTLQMIAGLMKPDEGEISLRDKVFFSSKKRIDLPPQKRNIGYLFQNFALFPHMTVRENILYGSKEGKLPKRLVELLEVEKILDKYPSQISGGEKQRVALIRALSRNPELLLLDEPFSALHREIREVLYEELQSVLNEFGYRALLVTHDYEEVVRLSGRVIVIDKGKVVQSGAPISVFLNPKNVKTARLLGHRNFIEGIVKSVNEKTITVKLKSGKEIRAKKRDGIVKGDKIVLSILPTSATFSPGVESNRVKLLITKIRRKPEFTEISGFFEESKVMLKIPAGLTPNFILEEGKTADINLTAEGIIPIKEER